jgi:tetratricopeptide (TPR) repeat protein
MRRGIPEYETVIALNRNWAAAYARLGWCKLLTGSIEETILLQEQAIRLSPRDSGIGLWYYRIGLVHLLQSRINDVILWLERARNAGAGLPYIHACLASAYALKSEAKRGATELAEARKLSSDDRYSSILRLKSVGDFGVPKIRALYEATYFTGLRKAGVPEE